MHYVPIMFHHFHGGSHPRIQGSLSAEALEALLQKIGLENILSADRWFESYESTGKIPSKACITFDDALLSQYEIALPVLQKYQLTAMWFVYSCVLVGEPSKLEIYRFFRNQSFSSIDEFYQSFFAAAAASFGSELQKALSEFDPSRYDAFVFYTYNDRKFRYLRDFVLGPPRYEQIMDQMIMKAGINLQEYQQHIWLNHTHIKDLAQKGHILGLHSHTHPTKIELLSLKQQREEYQTNYQLLKEYTRNPVRIAAHPSNSYNQDTQTVLRELGIEYAFRANTQLANYSDYELPRADHTCF